MADAAGIPETAGPGLRARFEEFGAGYPVILLATLLTGAFGTLLAATIINVALPTIIGAFGLGQDQVQWLSTGFLAAATSAMLLNAWAVSAFGARMTFLAAMIIFAVGSFLGAAANSLETLIAARVLQGIAAGLIQPLPMLLIFQAFPEHRRGTAFGLFALGVVLAPGIGPLLGGIAMDQLNWRFVFLVTAPLAVLALPVGYLVLPKRDDTEAKRPPFDGVGLVLLTAAVFVMLGGLAGTARDGWDSELTVLRFTIAGLLFGALIVWESRHPFPVLNLRVFANRVFLAGGSIVALQGFAIYGTTYLIPLFVQRVQDYSPTATGVLMLPAGLAMFIGFPVAGMLSDRVEVRWLILIGILAFGGSAFLMAQLSLDTPFWVLAWWLVISRIGISLIMPTANRTAVRDLPPDLMGAGVGAVNFLMQLGGAFGVNMLALTLQRRMIFHGETLATATNEANPEFLYTHELLRLQMSQEHMSALQAFQTAFGSLGQILATNASILAFRDCFYLTGLIFVGGLVLLVWLPPERNKRFFR